MHDIFKHEFARKYSKTPFETVTVINQIKLTCSFVLSDLRIYIRSSELLAKLQLEDPDLILKERMLRWFGHVERSSGAIRTAYDMQIDGKRGGRKAQANMEETDRERLP